MSADHELQTPSTAFDRTLFKLPASRFVLLFAVLMALAFLWLIADFFPRLDFWSFVGDYPMLSLAHALNVQAWFDSGLRQVGYFQEFHPGIPFQLASWLAFRVAQIFSPTDVSSSIQYTLQEPDLFWSVTQLLALSLGLVGVTALWRRSRRLSAGFAIAAMLVFFSFRPAWTYGLTTLSIDTFALPMAVLFFTVAAYAFRAEKRSLIFWGVLGGLGGLAWLLKLNYIVWSLAAGVGLLVQLALRGVTLRQFALRAGLFVLAFGAVGAFLGLLFLGPDGLTQTINYHIGVATHAGYFGSGSSELVNWNTIKDNLRTIAGRIDLWAATVVLLALAASIVFKYRRDRAWLKANLPIVACLVMAILFGYAAAIKHFFDHYLIVAGAVLPLLVLWLGQVSTRRMGIFLMPVVIVLVSITAYGYFQERSGFLSHMRAMRQDAETINSLPLTDGNVRLWSYRVNAGPYIANFTAAMTQVPSYFDDVKKVFPQDLEYDIWNTQVQFNHQWTSPDRVPWQYAIFDQAFFPNFASLPPYFQENGTEIRKLNTVLVVERKDGKNISSQSLGNGAVPKCTATFNNGWYPREPVGDSWLRWTDGQGQISIAASDDMAVLLQGKINSMQRPNTVDIVLNGNPVSALKTDWDEWAFKSFVPLTLKLKAGSNSLKFISHNPPITQTTDSRALAIAIKGLQLPPCELQP